MNLDRVLSSVFAMAALGLLSAVPPIGCSVGAAARRTAPPEIVPFSGLDAGAADATNEGAAKAAPSVKAHHHAVASENATATRVAMDVLSRGGNAADAAVAGVLAVGITHPVSSGIGGGGFAMVWDAKTRKTTVLDFRETAPAGLVAADYVTRPAREKRGVMVGVPGEVAGLSELHRRFGHLAFADVVGSAAEIAAKGFPVSPHLARTLSFNEKWIRDTPRYVIFHPAGPLLGIAEIVHNPALATTLKKIASEGKKAFYEGAVAADIVASAREVGSRITAADLKRYAVVEREPLAIRWEGYDVLTMPPPSAGGLMMLETLHMHSKEELISHGYQTGAYFHLLAETFRGAIADRVRAVGDPAFVKVDVGALASAARMKARRAKISLDTTTPAEKFSLDEGGTHHLVVVDAQGNVVSISSTVNNMFGAKIVTSGGFVLNDELHDFSAPSLDARFGIVRGPNAPRGGARPVSSMTPTLVFKDGAPILALGGSGGMRIATAVTQVLLAQLAFGRSVPAAVADPRIEAPPTGGLLLDGPASAELVGDLGRRGEVVDVTKPNFSAVQAIAVHDEVGIRVFEAGADPRKSGAASVQ